eukprot:jgi/Tetstr1/427606/TSEL_017731.t1
MRGGIEALYYGTDDCGAKVLDRPIISLTASTYSNYEGKIRLFAEFCIDEEGISPLDNINPTCVRYLAEVAERRTIGAGSLQPYLSASNTFLRHTAFIQILLSCDGGALRIWPWGSLRPGRTTAAYGSGRRCWPDVLGADEAKLTAGPAQLFQVI